MDAIPDAVDAACFDAINGCDKDMLLFLFAVRSREGICDDICFTAEVSDVCREFCYAGELVSLPSSVRFGFFG